MKETRFIDQNREKWKDLEEMLDKKQRDPDKLSDLFVQVTDDLSFARTYYGSRVVRVYLNQLTQRVFGSIYNNPVKLRGQFSKFWKTDLPFAMYLARKEMMISFLLFTISFLLGVVSSIYDPDFAASIMGSNYISMTEENIAANDPMAVYKQDGALNMFFKIGINNIRVGLMSFLSGLVFAVGALFMIVFNGIMVGVFQYFFISKGLFLDSALTIWMHGTFEISAIIIAGGAGLVLGRGVVFPGTYTRMQSLRLSARAGIRIMVGVVMLLFFAAVIESFITRLTEMNDLIRGGLILFMGGLVIYYFAWYPYLVAKSGAVILLDEQKLPATKPFEPQLEQIKNGSELFGSAFRIYNNILKRIWLKLLLLSVLLTALINFLLNVDLQNTLVYETSTRPFYFFFLKMPLIWRMEAEPVLLIIMGLSIAATGVWCGRSWIKEPLLNPFRTQQGTLKSEGPGMTLIRWIISILIVTPMMLSLMLENLGVLLFLLLLPVTLFTLMAYHINEKRNASISYGLGLLKHGLGSLYFLYSSLGLIGFLLMLFSDWAPSVLNLQILNWLYEADYNFYVASESFIIVLFFITAEVFVIPLFLAGFGAVYYNLEELSSGQGLKRKLAKAGLIPQSG